MGKFNQLLQVSNQLLQVFNQLLHVSNQLLQVLNQLLQVSNHQRHHTRKKYNELLLTTMNINLYKILSYIIGSVLIILLIIVYKIYTAVSKSDDTGFYKDLTLLIYWIGIGVYSLLLIYTLRRSKQPLLRSFSENIRFIIVVLIILFPLRILLNSRFIISLFLK